MDEVPIHLHIELLPEDVYLATSPDVPGLVAQGNTIAEVVEYAKDCTRMLIESCLEHGDPLPPKFRTPTPPPATLDIDVLVPFKAA